MNTRIITVSREVGSGGRTIGKAVAERLGIPYYDKELVDAVAKESGFSHEFIEEIGECAVRYLDGMIRRGEKPPMQTIIPSVLVKRASTSIYQPRESSQEKA